MAVVTLASQKNEPRFMVGSLEVDAVTSESITMSSKLSTQPVEDRSVITDNIILEPRLIRVKGIISLTSLTFLEIDNTLTSPSKLSDAYTILKELYETRTTFSLGTKYERFDNVVMINLDITRTPDDGDSLPFSATFQEVQLFPTRPVQGFRPEPSRRGALNNDDDKDPENQMTKQNSDVPTRVEGSILFNI